MPAPTEEPKIQTSNSGAREATASWMTGLGSLGETTEEEPQAQPIEEPAKPAAQPASVAQPKPAPAPAAGKDSPTELLVQELGLKKPAEPDEPADDKWPRSAENWKAYKDKRKQKEVKLLEQIKAHEDKIAAYEKKLQEHPTPANTAELETIRKENEELSKRLQTVEVTQHPKFVQYFEGKTKAQIDLAKSIVGPELAGKMEKLLQQPDGEWKSQQLEELWLELTPTAQSRIGGVLNALSEISRERQKEIDDSTANYKQIQEQKFAKAKEQQDQFEKLVTEVASEMTAQNPAFQKREGDEAWNSAVENRLKHAKNILTGSGLKPADIVRAAYHAAALQPVLEENLSLRGEIGKLVEQVKKLTAAQPTVQPANAPTEGQRRMETKPGTRPMDMSKLWAQNMVDALNGGGE